MLGIFFVNVIFITLQKKSFGKNKFEFHARVQKCHFASSSGFKPENLKLIMGKPDLTLKFRVRFLSFQVFGALVGHSSPECTADLDQTLIICLPRLEKYK